MKEKIAFIVESTKLAHRTFIHLSENHKDKEIYIISMKVIGLYEFSYPRDLKLTDFPYLSNPKWQESSLASPVVFKVHDDSLESTRDPFSSVLREADVIAFLGSPDASNAVNFNIITHKVFGCDLTQSDCTAHFLTDLSANSVVKALNRPQRTSEEGFVGLVREGYAKKYFDYNFNINSLWIFGIALRDIGVNTNDFLLSKYSLQMLYDLRNRTKIEASDFLKLTVIDWPGTGKYKAADLNITKIGSVTSFTQILENLSTAGLIDFDRKNISITNTGRDLLLRIHPDCCDKDLPFRLADWQRNWPNSKPQIDRYIKTFFGKQKRFNTAGIKSDVNRQD